MVQKSNETNPIDLTCGALQQNANSLQRSRNQIVGEGGEAEIYKQKCIWSFICTMAETAVIPPQRTFIPISTDLHISTHKPLDGRICCILENGII